MVGELARIRYTFSNFLMQGVALFGSTMPLEKNRCRDCLDSLDAMVKSNDFLKRFLKFLNIDSDSA